MREFGKIPDTQPQLKTRYQRLSVPDATDFSSPAGFDRLVKQLSERNIKYQMDQERQAARKRQYQGKRK